MNVGEPRRLLFSVYLSLGELIQSRSLKYVLMFDSWILSLAQISSLYIKPRYSTASIVLSLGYFTGILTLPCLKNWTAEFQPCPSSIYSQCCSQILCFKIRGKASRDILVKRLYTSVKECTPLIYSVCEQLEEGFWHFKKKGTFLSEVLVLLRLLGAFLRRWPTLPSSCSCH